MVLSAEAVNMLRELELSLGSTTTDHRGPSWPFSLWLQSQLVHILHEWSHEPDTSTPLPHTRQDTTKTSWLYIFFTEQDIRTKPMKGIYISDGKDTDKFSLNSYICDRKPNRMHNIIHPQQSSFTCVRVARECMDCLLAPEGKDHDVCVPRARGHQTLRIHIISWEHTHTGHIGGVAAVNLLWLIHISVKIKITMLENSLLYSLFAH